MLLTLLQAPATAIFLLQAASGYGRKTNNIDHKRAKSNRLFWLSFLVRYLLIYGTASDLHRNLMYIARKHHPGQLQVSTVTMGSCTLPV